MIEQVLLIIQVVVCVFLVLLVLVQQGKGATMGAAFGSGASSTVFGSKGSGSFLMKFTALVAFIFFANSLGLCYVSAQQAKLAKDNILIEIPNPMEMPQVRPVKQVAQPQVSAPLVKSQAATVKPVEKKSSVSLAAQEKLASPGQGTMSK